MSNIKWSGIEQWKYGLTARWYVSAYYGNDTDVDAVGLYNPSTNPTGHGGPTRPFATLDKLVQTMTSADVCVFDSGYYTGSTSNAGNSFSFVGDGTVVFGQAPALNLIHLYNVTVINSKIVSVRSFFTDSLILYCSNVNQRDDFTHLRNTYIECNFTLTTPFGIRYRHCNFIKCGGTLYAIDSIDNCFFDSCSNLTLSVNSERNVGSIIDYSAIIGTVKTSVAINSKTTGVTVEDFKAHGQYFIKSYSEVDLFGNASGSGATVSQLNQIFNNFYYPYIDDYHNLDLTLRPDCDERVRFGGLNGTYIGALPVGYRLSASELWNTHIDVANTSNLDYDLVNNAIVLAAGQDVGTYTSLIIDLGVPITVDMVDFMANFVYNIEGTAKQGVSNQRIDTTPDLLPDNTKNQRVVYDYRLQYSPDGVTALTGWENMELNRMPTVDGDGLYQLEDGFSQATAQKLTIQRLKLEFTLRRIIIA